MDPTQQGRRLTEKDWKCHETVIRDLFLKYGLSLRKVKAYMEKEHKFTANERQWKHRIKRWKLDRNVKDPEMRAIVRKKQHRAITEPDRSQLSFRVRKFDVNSKKILRWMKEHNVPDDQLYTGDSGARTSSDISYYTPSREGSPSAADDVEVAEAVSVLPTNPIPEDAYSHTIEISRPEPSSLAVAPNVASEPPKPGCWVETTDLSWAFDTPWQVLLSGHESDPEGRPLAALVTALKEEAYKQGLPFSAGTLISVLRVESTENVHDSHRNFRVLAIPRTSQWGVCFERTTISKSTLLVWAHVERTSLSGEQYDWLDLRLRISSGNRYYREGLAEFRVTHGPRSSEALFKAIRKDDIDEAERLLSAGEATVISVERGFAYPLETSAYDGNVRISRLLLERGSPINRGVGTSDNIIWDIWSGFASPIYRNGFPSFEDKFARCKELMRLASHYGAHIDECISGFRGNILFAVNNTKNLESHQWRQVLQYLLDLGVGLEYRDAYGNTPLLDAVNLVPPDPNLVSAYLEMEANILATDNKGQGYLHLIISNMLNFVQYANVSCQETMVILLRADPRFRKQPITPLETPLIGRLAHETDAWTLWRAVFEDMGWDFTETEQYAMSLPPRNLYIGFGF